MVENLKKLYDAKIAELSEHAEEELKECTSEPKEVVILCNPPDYNDITDRLSELSKAFKERYFGNDDAKAIDDTVLLINTIGPFCALAAIDFINYSNRMVKNTVISILASYAKDSLNREDASSKLITLMNLLEEYI